MTYHFEWSNFIVSGVHNFEIFYDDKEGDKEICLVIFEGGKFSLLGEMLRVDHKILINAAKDCKMKLLH